MPDKEDVTDWEQWSRFVLNELTRLGNATESSNSKLQDMSLRLLEYNAELREHIRGVRALEAANLQRKEEFDIAMKALDKRLETAELPIEWIKRTSTVVAWTAGIAGSIAAIWAFFF